MPALVPLPVGNYDVAVMNVDVVEISASSKKHTIHGGVVVWCG